MVLDPQVAVSLTIANRKGSVEHYYHFLLGFLLPLAAKHAALTKLGQKGPIYVRDCGPMDRILKEVGFPRVHILDRDQHQRNASQTTMDGRPMRHETVDGMDCTDGDYPVAAMRQAVDILRSQMQSRGHQSAQAPAKERKVVLINRSVDPYYNSAAAELPTSGLQRRSIRNFAEARSVLEIVRPELVDVVLENATLAEQMALFASADVIIAQHGAALANVIWCQPGTRVIEIAPRGYKDWIFSSLSKAFDLDHRLVHQEGQHGDCDIPGLISNVM